LRPNKGLYHMSTEVSAFYTREIYNDALWQRLGEPASLDDYLLKAQIMDYEATRAEFEGFSIMWSAERPATGLIYWMLNNAWPSLHWNLFDYYLRPAGSYFGAKVGTKREHIAYEYVKKDIWLINHSIDLAGPRTVEVEIIDLEGSSLFSETKEVDTVPNVSKSILDISDALGEITGVVFLRLILSSEEGVLSRNVYWLADTIDTLEWDDSTWYYTPVTEYADLTALNDLQVAELSVSVPSSFQTGGTRVVTLENLSNVPAFFVRLHLVDGEGEDVLPVFWSDNYVTLWPNETLELQVESDGGSVIQVTGMNIESSETLV
jgi:exo-1,4-beta-D-glucosaminidase